MKKTFKKLMAALLAVALLCAMAVPAFAAEGSGSITINKAINGETYTAYKIFDVVSSKEEADGSKTYVYTVAAGWANFFTNDTVKDYVSVDTHGQPTWVESKKSDTDLQDFAKLALTYASENNITGKTETASDGKAVISGLTAGYYVVSTTAGSLCILNTNGSDLTINEKNEAPTINKKIDSGKDSNDAAIGDVVNYTVTIHAKKGATGYVLTDTMTKGLTFNNDVKVTVGSSDLTLDRDYAVNYPVDGATFKVTFTENYLNTIDGDTEIVVSYTATVNKNAEIGTTTGNTNTAQLKYGNKSTVDSKTTTYSYEFDLVKTDSSNKLLTGAKFKLYDSVAGTTPVKLIKDAATGNYRVAEKNEDGAVKEIEISSYKAVTISGLNKKTYYLEETQAPAGYNKLTERQPVDLGKEGFVANATLTGPDAKGVEWTSGGVRVINNTGATLPSTGGMGTTLFYVIGGGLMVAAVVLLVTKKRMENK